jgi:type IV pilus assembly protein PilM
MASPVPGVWGIDLGQSALKAIRLQLVNGEVVGTAFDYIEHPKILSQPDADPDALTREALETFLSRNTIRGDLIAISVPGQTGLARFVKLPPVEAKKIPDIVRFEAKQQIPFPLEEVVWDWQKLGSQAAEDFSENEIGLFAMKRDMVNRYLQAFRDVNVEVHIVQMSPLALCNFVAYDVLGKDVDSVGDEEGKKQCAVALDIGSDNTNLVVTDGNKIIWQRPIPIGGNHFTRALTKDMKLTFAKAEHLKRNATKAEDPKRIFQSMKPVFSDFVGELTRSLGFFSNTHRDAANLQRIIGLGNAFRLPGLQKFISQTLGNELEKLNAFTRLKGDEILNSPVYAENVLSFGVAYGLALQGLGVTRLRTNLLPQEIQFERMIRSKKPWAAAAVASLLVGVTVFHAAASNQFQTSAEAKTAADSANSVVTLSQRYKDDFKKRQDELKDARDRAAKILRGGEERTNWSILHRYINDCLPQPDGRNVPRYPLADGTVPWNKYNNDAAQRAYRTKRERDEEGRLDDIDWNNLMQINVQGIYTRYCDAQMASNYYDFVRDQAIEKTTLRATDWGGATERKPPGKGWAVEVRGFTYYTGKDPNGVHFIIDTFLENLQMKKVVLSPGDDPASRKLDLKLSHFALLVWDAATVPGTKNTEFKFISGSVRLNDVVKSKNQAGGADMRSMMSGGGGGGGKTLGVGGAGSADTGGGGGPGGGKSRGDWVGLGDQLSGSSGSSGSGTNYPGMTSREDSTQGRRGMPGAGSGSGATTEETPKTAVGERKRTEFIIVFFWQEDLPTEGEMPVPEGGGEGMPGGTGGMPGMPARGN